MRWTKRGGIIAACVLLPVGLVSGCWVAETAQTRAFYEAHGLVDAMNKATEGIDPWKTDPRFLRRDVLLGRVPLGTAQAETLRLLSSEGFACQQWNASRGSYAAFD